MAGRSDLIDVAVELRAETEKAWQVFDGTRSSWVPKSQAEFDQVSGVPTLPEWLAIEKGMI